MSIALRTLRAGLLTLVICVAATPAPVFAQSFGAIGEDTGIKRDARVLPPDPGNPTPPNSAVVYLLMFVLLAAAVGLSILPSQRTHAD